MYAVIKTGGKQYKVNAGDLIVVDKLASAPGAEVAFEEVLMLGQGEAVTVGAPFVAGAKVSATLIETRKGVKIKVFKKIRRQGYRRTRGHRQLESVLRVTGISGEGKSEAWEGAIDLTPLAVLKARARNLARDMEAATAEAAEPKPAKAARPSKAETKAAASKPAAKSRPAAKAKPAAKATAKPAAKAKSATKPAVKAAKPAKPPAKPAAKKPTAKKPKG